MGRNRVFFPQEALDYLLSENKIDLTTNLLTMRGEGRTYKIVEAVHVLAEVSGGQDPYELIGKVKTRGYVAELGAELLGNSMIIGDNAYDVIPGWVGAPVGSFEDHRAQGATPQTVPSARSDEELLAQFLIQKLEPR
jgi:hypothetical protein